jgi:drug/metabolite transporter (DMT)-like permease
VTTAIALLCVVGIACGQILFKLCAKAYQTHGLLTSQTLTLFFAAMGLYGLTTLVWIWVLSRSELGKVYPLMALAFVLVPAATYLLFDERFSTPYLIGIGLIVVGIALTSQG